jgi:hypothetical protein
MAEKIATTKNSPVKKEAAAPVKKETAEPSPAPASPTPAPASDQVAPPEKRGRGRPSNVERMAREGAEPVAPGTDAPVLRTRKARSKKPVMDMDKGLLAKQLQGLHLIAVNVTGMPELAISDPEAAMLSDAVVNVCEEYGLSISGKTGALIQLLAACGMVYLPRLAKVKQRMEQVKAQRAARVINGAEHVDAPATH